MSELCARPILNPMLERARSILQQESQAIRDLAGRLDESFVAAIEMLDACSGAIIVVGMGKAGLVGQKIAATLASTGTRSHFVHPAEAVHGDLGRIGPDDVVLMLSFSGETEEVLRIIPSLQHQSVPIIALTSDAGSRLAAGAAVTIELGSISEVCALGLAPSTSTTAMLAVGDALALVLSERREFKAGDFARFHPGGSLGRKLASVNDVMRSLADCRVALHTSTLRAVISDLAGRSRRTGAVLLVDADGMLKGIFTDSDLARLLSAQRDQMLDQPIHEVMTESPSTLEAGATLTEAIDMMVDRKISELPIVAAGRLVGMIDITDVLELLPNEVSQDEASSGDPADILPFSNPQGERHVNETRRTQRKD